MLPLTLLSRVLATMAILHTFQIPSCPRKKRHGRCHLLDKQCSYTCTIHWWVLHRHLTWRKEPPLALFMCLTDHSFHGNHVIRQYPVVWPQFYLSDQYKCGIYGTLSFILQEDDTTGMSGYIWYGTRNTGVVHSDRERYMIKLSKGKDIGVDFWKHFKSPIYLTHENTMVFKVMSELSLFLEIKFFRN